MVYNPKIIIHSSTRLLCGAFLLGGALGVQVVQAVQSHGHLYGEWRQFDDRGLLGQQEGHLSAALLLDYRWDGSSQQSGGFGQRGGYLHIQPFLRWDLHDSDRTHIDLRELSWNDQYRGLDWRVGIKKVFWGVTESQHLVDIINQTDLVESIDGEEKLGQPMINLSYAITVGDTDFGIVDVYALLGFRERTFPSEDGRSLFTLPIDDDQVTYESSDEERHIDYALRWEHYYSVMAGELSLGDVEWALSYFSGTSRDPTLTLTSAQTLAPHYPQIRQVGLELQWVIGEWIVKWESIDREGENEAVATDFSAYTTGFEWTQIGIMESATDLGWIIEYLRHSRTTFEVTGDANNLFFDDDWFFGWRFNLNDSDSSEVLAGVIADLSTGHRVVRVEGSRRWRDHITVELEVNWVRDFDDPQPSGSHSDDSVTVTLGYHW